MQEQGLKGHGAVKRDRNQIRRRFLIQNLTYAAIIVIIVIAHHRLGYQMPTKSVNVNACAVRKT